MHLDSVSALVTGGSSGLGLATVRRLRAAGARVGIADLNPPSDDDLAELGEGVVYVKADVADEASVTAALDAIEAAHGGLRATVHCAGRGGDRVRILDRDGNPGSLDTFAEVVRVNLVGTYNVLRLAAARIARAEPVDPTTTPGWRSACWRTPTSTARRSASTARSGCRRASPRAPSAQQADPAVDQALGVIAQPCADARKGQLDDDREGDRPEYLTARRGQHIEPGVADEQRGRRGGRYRQVPGSAKREIAGGAQRDQLENVKSHPRGAVVTRDLTIRKREPEVHDPGNETNGTEEEGRSHPALYLGFAQIVHSRSLFGGRRSVTFLATADDAAQADLPLAYNRIRCPTW